MFRARARNCPLRDWRSGNRNRRPESPLRWQEIGRQGGHPPAQVPRGAFPINGRWILLLVSLASFGSSQTAGSTGKCAATAAVILHEGVPRRRARARDFDNGTF